MENYFVLVAATLLNALVVAGTTSVGAQDYPNKPIRMVVPYAPGGGVDIVARVTAQGLAKALGQPIVTENRTGASGATGSDFVAKATPDGYTLAMVDIPHAIIPSLFLKMPYDTLKDFAPLTQVSSQPYILGVHPSVPAKSIKELIALSKAKPGQLNYGSAGPGTAPHMATELLKTLTGIDVVHVPYNGGAPAIIAVISGEISMLFATLPAIFGHVKAGKMRALAVSSVKRAPAVPDLPTIAEAGLPEFEVVSWVGMLAPAKTPRPIVTKLQSEIVRVLQSRDIKDRFAADGSAPIGSTPEEFGAYIDTEISKWAKVVKASGMRVD